MTGTTTNFLGIDWGAAKVGLALAHAETRVALPYAVINNNQNFFDTLIDIIAREGVGTVIIGIPRREKTSDRHPGYVLGEKLSRQLPLRVEYADEMFTTRLAQQALVQRGEKAVDKKDDAEAARILLEGWLDHPADDCQTR